MCIGLIRGIRGSLPNKFFNLPEGFTAGAVQYPIPERVDVTGGMVSYAYTDEVMLMATITPPADFDGGEDNEHRAAKVSWLVCKENCVKGDAKVRVTLKTGAKPQADNEGEFAKWNEMLPKKTDQVVQDVQVDLLGGSFKSASTAAVGGEMGQDAGEGGVVFPMRRSRYLVTSNDLKTENGQSTGRRFKVNLYRRRKVSDAVFDLVLAYSLDGKRVGLAVPVRLSQAK